MDHWNPLDSWKNFEYELKLIWSNIVYTFNMIESFMPYIFYNIDFDGTVYFNIERDKFLKIL